MRIIHSVALSLVALLATISFGQTDNIVDPTFQPALTVAPDIVVPLPDGRIYIASANETFTVAGHRQRGLARLLIDGSVDPAFDVGSGTDTGTITALDVLADGRVALTGTFNAINGIARPTLAVLRANGALDPTFQPDPALLVSGPTLRYPLLDGRWIVGTVANQNLTFARFSETGRADSAYRSASLDLRQPPLSGGFDFSPTFNRVTISSRDASGRLCFVARFSTFSGSYENFYRISAVGEFEPEISRRLSTSATLGTFDVSEETVLEIDGQRALIQYRRTSGGMFGGSGSYGFSVRALFPTGFDPVIPGLFSSTNFSQLSALSYGFGRQATFGRDGIYAKSYGARGRNGIVRLDFDGNLDQDFSCEIAEFNIPGGFLPPGGAADFYLLSNGQILLRANAVNGTRTNFLARLTPIRRAGNAHLSNFSVLTQIPSGSQPLILGFVVANGPKNLLARAIGPTLSQFGLGGAAADPALAVLTGVGALAGNDDWPISIADIGASVGLLRFPPEAATRPSSRPSALDRINSSSPKKAASAARRLPNSIPPTRDPPEPGAPAW